MASTQCLLAGPRHVVADPTSACRAPPVCARAAMVTLKARGKRRRWPARSWPEAAMAAAVCAALGASTATSAVGDEALDEASSAEAGEAASVDLGAAPPWGPKDRMRLSRPASLAQTTPARLASLAQIRTALSSRLRLPISVSSPCLACALACGWRGGSSPLAMATTPLRPTRRRHSVPLAAARRMRCSCPRGRRRAGCQCSGSAARRLGCHCAGGLCARRRAAPCSGPAGCACTCARACVRALARHCVCQACAGGALGARTLCPTAPRGARAARPPHPPVRWCQLARGVAPAGPRASMHAPASSASVPRKAARRHRHRAGGVGARRGMGPGFCPLLDAALRGVAKRWGSALGRHHLRYIGGLRRGPTPGSPRELAPRFALQRWAVAQASGARPWPGEDVGVFLRRRAGTAARLILP